MWAGRGDFTPTAAVAHRWCNNALIFHSPWTMTTVSFRAGNETKRVYFESTINPSHRPKARIPAQTLCRLYTTGTDPAMLEFDGTTTAPGYLAEKGACCC
jgi:hypothetical protein